MGEENFAKNAVTWRHVKGGAAAEVGSDTVSGCQAEICKFNRVALVGDQDVLGLQISVVDSNGVTVSNSVQNLQESMLGQRVIADELSSLRDVGK